MNHRQPRCPVCDDPADPATHPAFPFCSSRCRQIDLGRWFNEQYSMPEYRDPDDDPESWDDDAPRDP